LASPVKVYWDSCAWLGLLNGEADRRRELEAIYDQARNGLVEIWSSTISIVEANRLASEVGQSKPIPPDSLLALDDLLFQPFVKLAAVDTVIAKDARRLIREIPGLGKKPDAIHAATAMHWNIETLHTYDGNDLLHLDGKLECRNGTPLTICQPSDPTAGGLFAKSEKPKPA
jgi:predicted nucleic acid-binding protein